MAENSGPHRQSRPNRRARNRNHLADQDPPWQSTRLPHNQAKPTTLRAAIIATAMAVTAALAGTAGAGQAMAGTGSSVQPVSAAADAGPGTGNSAGATPANGMIGNDVSSRQGGGVDWGRTSARGAQFAFVKATEGSYYTNPDFATDFSGTHAAGMVRGAYAFAIPSRSSGADQADYFVSNGGAWSADGHTLPGALDIEYNPYGKDWCYGLSQNAMVSWIRDFLNEYHARTGRWAIVYTTYRWWSACTGNYAGFAANDPLWIAHYGSSAGTLPAGWSNYTFWQYADSGSFPGDQDVFNGSADRLLALANNTA